MRSETELRPSQKSAERKKGSDEPEGKREEGKPRTVDEERGKSQASLPMPMPMPPAQRKKSSALELRRQ